MASWLMDRLGEVAASGYQDEQEAEDARNSVPEGTRAGSSLEQADEVREVIVTAGNREDEEVDEVLNAGPYRSRGGALLEQGDQVEEKNPLEAPWVVQFRQFVSPMIGLNWAGTVEQVPRLAA